MGCFASKVAAGENQQPLTPSKRGAKQRASTNGAAAQRGAKIRAYTSMRTKMCKLKAHFMLGFS